MPAMTKEPRVRWQRGLTSISGKTLLVAFWAAFLVASVAAGLPEPISTVVGGTAQLVLVIIWIGYPIALLHCLSGHRVQRIGVPLIACGALVGYGLSVLLYDENGDFWRSTVAPLLGAVLLFAPFAAGAYALWSGEKAANLPHARHLVATALALFALPFFGAYSHKRFCLTYSILNGTPDSHAR